MVSLNVHDLFLKITVIRFKEIKFLLSQYNIEFLIAVYFTAKTAELIIILDEVLVTIVFHVNFYCYIPDLRQTTLTT